MSSRWGRGAKTTRMLQLCRYTVARDVPSSLCIIYLWTTITVPSGLSRQASA